MNKPKKKNIKTVKSVKDSGTSIDINENHGIIRYLRALDAKKEKQNEGR